MEKENNFSSAEKYSNWITFYLNYLDHYFSEATFPLFQKKWQSYWKLFQYWKEKKLDQREISTLVKELQETRKSFATLVKKYEKKTQINHQLIEQELKSLWDKNLAQKLTTDYQKVQNYLLGQIKKKFPDYPMKEVVLIILNFLSAKN